MTTPQPARLGNERWHEQGMAAEPTDDERAAQAAWAEYWHTGDSAPLIALGLIPTDE